MNTEKIAAILYDMATMLKQENDEAEERYAERFPERVDTPPKNERK